MILKGTPASPQNGSPRLRPQARSEGVKIDSKEDGNLTTKTAQVEEPAASAADERFFSSAFTVRLAIYTRPRR